MEPIAMALQMRNWVNVPPGSLLSVRVTGDDVVARGVAQAERDGDLVPRELSDAELKRGWRDEVRTEVTTSVVVFLTFALPVPVAAAVAGWVVKPDGSTYGRPYEQTFERRAGDPEVHVILTATGGA